MDALSHALIGLSVAGLSGQPFSVAEPVYLATILGSQAPDFDIVAHLRSHFSYMKQHRVFSHSLPGLIAWSLFIAGTIYLFEPGTGFFTLFCWSLAGSLSHIIADYFNTHGTALSWPFNKQRKSCKLLNVFDPVLLLVMLTILILNLPALISSLLTFAALLFYIIVRIALKHRAANWLYGQFGGKFFVQELALMPSLKRLLFWDFVLETPDQIIVGQIGALYPVIEIKCSFPVRKTMSYGTIKAQQTFIGDFFRTFSPLIYYEENINDNFLTVNIYDLRYLINQQFRHSATVIFDKDYTQVDAYMISYGRIIRLPD